MRTCRRHQPSLRDRSDIGSREVSDVATATAHDCLVCGELVYRIHTRPVLRDVARYNGSAVASSPKRGSRTDQRTTVLSALRELPAHERSVRRHEVAA